MSNSPTLALSLLLTTKNGSFEYFNCMHRYITMVCNFGDIHAPQNLLWCLKSNQRSISCKGSQTLEIETQTEKNHGNTSSRKYLPDLVNLAIGNIANYLKYNYFLDDDGIDNVTLRLWKFSDFCSRHTVGVAGDDIMFHILVIYSSVGNLCYVFVSSMLHIFNTNKKQSALESYHMINSLTKQNCLYAVQMFLF